MKDTARYDNRQHEPTGLSQVNASRQRRVERNGQELEQASGEDGSTDLCRAVTLHPPEKHGREINRPENPDSRDERK
jgi:hypothetical protein